MLVRDLIFIITPFLDKQSCFRCAIAFNIDYLRDFANGIYWQECILANRIDLINDHVLKNAHLMNIAISTGNIQMVSLLESHNLPYNLLMAGVYAIIPNSESKSLKMLIFLNDRGILSYRFVEMIKTEAKKNQYKTILIWIKENICFR